MGQQNKKLWNICKTIVELTHEGLFDYEVAAQLIWWNSMPTDVLSYFTSRLFHLIVIHEDWDIIAVWVDVVKQQTSIGEPSPTSIKARAFFKKLGSLRG